MIMEFMEGGTLHQVIENRAELQETHITFIAKEVLIGLNHLHNINLVHRDIKPSNIAIGISGEIKIIDFGLAFDLSQGLCSRMVGSCHWMAPETIKKENYGTAADVWGLGICLLELLNCCFFIESKSSLKMMFDVCVKGAPALSQSRDKSWSNELTSFIFSFLETDQKKRPKASELLNQPILNISASLKEMKHTFKIMFLKKNMDNVGIDLI